MGRKRSLRAKQLLRWAFAAILMLASVTESLSGQEAPATKVVTFTLDFPGSVPSHYSISVEGTGQANYECTVKSEGDGEEQLYSYQFVVSEGNRERIFQWAKQAKYFAGKLDSGNRKIAFTGDKTLSYQDGQRSFTAQYNYSSLDAVREITAFFQNMAGTLEYGRKLAFLYKYQKLGLDDELKRMEAQARNNQLSELQGVEPVLQQIVRDTSVINGVRARAMELIRMGNEVGRH